MEIPRRKLNFWEEFVRVILLAILAAAAPVILPAGTINFTSSSDTVSFNNSSSTGTLTLGNDTCESSQPTCTLTATASGTSDGTVTLSLTMPNDPTSPYSYANYWSGGPEAITTTGSPTTSASLTDIFGDSATGTFALSNIASDGGTGVDIMGSVTITSIGTGTAIANFDSLFGLPSSTALAFTLDVGDCQSGSRPRPCIDPDPTAQFISLDLTPGTPSSAPEPGTFGLLGCASAVAFIALRRRRSSESWL